MGQGAQRFVISDINPNDGIGGGGCLCMPVRGDDQGGPYAIFPATETDSNVSPHAVLCAGCARGIVRACEVGERLAAGEDGVERPAGDEDAPAL